MKRLSMMVACGLLLTACGLFNRDKGANDTENIEAAAPATEEVIAVAYQEPEDINALSIEERVDYYLSRFCHDSSLGDEAKAAASRQEMLDWLESLTDEEKCLADDASDEWYSKNYTRL